MICKQKLTRMMDGLGFREAMIGTEMIRQAVYIVDEDRSAMMCKDVYPAIAVGMGTTAARVERAMRAAVAAAQRSPAWGEAWRELGGWNEPTNSEVVRRLARECQPDPEERRSIGGMLRERFPEIATYKGVSY